MIYPLSNEFTAFITIYCNQSITSNTLAICCSAPCLNFLSVQCLYIVIEQNNSSFFFVSSTEKNKCTFPSVGGNIMHETCPNKNLINWTNFNLSLFHMSLNILKSYDAPSKTETTWKYCSDVKHSIHSISTTSCLHGYPAMGMAKSLSKTNWTEAVS